MADAIDHLCCPCYANHPNAIGQLASINRRKILFGEEQGDRRAAIDHCRDIDCGCADLVGDVPNGHDVEIVIDFSGEPPHFVERIFRASEFTCFFEGVGDKNAQLPALAIGDIT